MSVIKLAEDFVKQKLANEVIEHTLRVRNYAVKLAEEENAEDKELVELAALLHDVGYIKGYKDHDRSGAPIAREFLNKQSYDLTKAGKVINCILKHGPKSNPGTAEEKILWDADCLDRLGALGIMRIGPKFVKHDVCTAEELPTKLKMMLEIHAAKLHTETAKKFAQQFVALQKKFFNELDQQLNIINNDFDFLYKIMEE